MSRSSSSMGGLGKFTELRQRLLFVLGALLVYRVGSFIPVPGVNPDAMLALMEQQKGTIVDMFNMFSGGGIGRASCRERGCKYVEYSVVAGTLKKKKKT